jgi:hypothetical protein
MSHVAIGVVVRSALFVSLAIGSPAPSLAQEFPLLTPPPAFAPRQPLRPYGDLFAAPGPRKSKPEPLVNLPSGAIVVGPRLNGRPLAVCPMQSQPADPSFDAAMREVLPDKAVSFTMRSAPRLACRTK